MGGGGGGCSSGTGLRLESSKMLKTMTMKGWCSHVRGRRDT